jgi:hypothetical protein
MRALLHRAVPVVIAVTLCVSPTPAWTPETRVRMVDEAVRLLPYSLRLALERHREALLRGALEPMTNEDGPAHLPAASGGSLESSISDAAAGLLGALERPEPFPEIARRFGTLAHYVSDAGFPPGAAGREGLERYRHFAGFCETRRERFPVVFYGHDDDDLARRDYAAFAQGIVGRAAREDGELARAYAAAGDPPDPSAFDDRSVPFAVGSLSYSHSITEIVRIWFAVWEQAGGDTGRTPYRNGGGPERERGRP